MPGTTPRLAWPTMLDTDPMADVALSIRNLGNAIAGTSGDLALASGWTSASTVHYRSSGGVVTVYVDTIKATAWAASEAMTSVALPGALRPVRSTYQAIAFRTTGGAAIAYVSPDGFVRAMLANAGGAGVGFIGAITYNL